MHAGKSNKSRNIPDITTPDTSEIKPTDKKDYRCAPTVEFKNGSCIPLDLLIQMAGAYNATATNKITLYPYLETLNPTKYKKYLIKEFNTKLSKVCDNQRCWIKQKFISNMNEDSRDNLLKYTYRPKGPNGKFTWLNTFNINDVMDQYEQKYPEFKFMGAVPIDFDELPELGIKNMNFDDMLKKGKSKLGIIFNLDEHWKRGSHWVAAYTDLKNGKVYFFDSYGIEPEIRIRKLLRRFARYIRDRQCVKTPEITHNKIPLKRPQDGGIDTDIEYNDKRHQYKNSECGVYSINFILRLLNGEDFDKITQNVTDDDKMNLNREIYFT